MDVAGTLMNISGAIADYPRLDVVLAIAFIGWIAGAWIMRRSTKRQSGKTT